MRDFSFFKQKIVHLQYYKHNKIRFIMSVQEQQEVRQKYYSEAVRYMDNAKEYLKNAKKEDYLYRDLKYVRTACATAYSGVLIALDGFLILKGVHKPTGKERKSIEYYQKNLGQLDKKMLDNLNVTYKILHLWGYYDGIEDTRVVSIGLETAGKIIEKIKPSYE
jgi:hypothetical protein